MSTQNGKIGFAGSLLLLIALVGVAPAATDPTAEEQYLLEIINRTRWNPDAEVFRLSNQTWGDTGSPATPDLNEGITNSVINDDHAQPLAFNRNIIQAARDYSTTLLEQQRIRAHLRRHHAAIAHGSRGLRLHAVL